ncbi:MAG: superfamily C-terminal [Candidatus Nomurabacteria bacterium]|nr:superfamily C-terminal [Candidatus Nomurabacteria bacterium]
MKDFLLKHKLFWTDRAVLFHLLVSVGLFVISLLLTYIATTYTKTYSQYIVPDLLLDILPVINVGIIFFQGAFIFILILVGVLFYEPKYIPFVLESTALFFFVRSLFMVMTHLTAPSVEYYNYIHHENHVKEILFTVSSGNDLFFSGHAGYPFLLALIFWQSKYLRYFFLLSSLVGAVIVILGHLHYSIDVFSAFFIAYGVFEISRFFFKKERRLTL